MATYIQLETLVRDSTVQTRIVWAARVAAEAIAANPAAPTNQQKWADKIRRGQFDVRMVTGLTALAMRNATLQASIAGTDAAPTFGATDSDIQFVMNSLVNVAADLATVS